ncbi:MAG: AEC family transporter [Pseudomonadota bacterium]
MVDIFLKTVPFFALIGLGYGAVRVGFFSQEATAYLTKFVFYFALSAMLFGFASNLSVAEAFSWPFVLAYLLASLTVYVLAFVIAVLRRRPFVEAAVEAQCAVIGNTGFLGIPMLVGIMGEAAIAPALMVLAVDLIVFSSIITVAITGSRGDGGVFGVLATAGMGLVKNPMIVSITAGLLVSAFSLPVPAPAAEFLLILGAAATPCALFAIGASLADKSTERLSVAGWLTFAKLVLHPAAVAGAALLIFPVAPFGVAVMVACAALPVAGNVYILAQHYQVAPQRVSTAILVSTVLSIVTVSLVIAWVSDLAGIGVAS